MMSDEWRPLALFEDDDRAKEGTIVAQLGGALPKRTDPDAAERLVRSRGGTPLVPFPRRGDLPWAIRCDTCGGISTPRFADIKKAERGGICNQKCRGLAIGDALSHSEADAIAIMHSWGWVPLDRYPGAGAPWLSACAECGAEFRKMLSHVQRGAGGCRRCGGSYVTPAEATQLMLSKSLRPVDEFPGAQRPWDCQCMVCGEFGAPTYSKVKMRGHQCWHCRAGAISAKLRMTSDEAERRIRKLGYEPLGPYPGSVDEPWPVRCPGRPEADPPIAPHELQPGPRLHNLLAGQGACPSCVGRGFNPQRAGYIYLVVHPTLKALKWGIANREERLRQHLNQGWGLHRRWTCELGSLAREYEAAVHRWVRTERQIPPALVAGQMKYRGHTETASTMLIDPAEVEAYIGALVARGASAPHRAPLVATPPQPRSPIRGGPVPRVD